MRHLIFLCRQQKAPVSSFDKTGVCIAMSCALAARGRLVSQDLFVAQAAVAREVVAAAEHLHFHAKLFGHFGERVATFHLIEVRALRVV